MTQSISLDKTALTGFMKLLGNWRATIPSHQDNVERLKLWRALLEGMTLEQRVSAAWDLEMLDAALSYVPTPSRVSQQPRPLDWEGIDPSKAKYDADAKALEELLQEQQAWIKAGLIDGPTASSSEWPAVALIGASIKNARPSPHTGHALIKATIDKMPGVFKVAKEGIQAHQWEHILTQRPGSPTNSSVFSSLLQQPDLARELAATLPPHVVDMRNEKNQNAFFGLGVAVEDIELWTKAGMDPTARDSKGMFAEESAVWQSPERVAAYHRALNSHRSRREQKLATWRLAVSKLEEGGDSVVKDDLLFEALLEPPPSDAQTQTTVLNQIRCERATFLPLFAEGLEKVIQRLHNESRLGAWLDMQGGAAPVAGILAASSLAEGSKVALESATNLASSFQVSTEELLINTLKMASRLSDVAPAMHKQKVAYKDLVRSFLDDSKVKHADQWLELIASLEAPMLDLTKNSMAGACLLNMLAHVVAQLPHDLLQNERMGPALWSMAVVNATAAWDDLDDELEGLFPTLDRTALDSTLEQALRAPGVGKWWKEREAWVIDTVRKQAPAFYTRLEAAALESSLPDPSQASLRSRPRM